MGEVSARVMSRGVRLQHNDHEWEMNNLLYAESPVLIADSEDRLQRLVIDYGVVCWRRKLTGNVSKNKVMVVSNPRVHDANAILNGERKKLIALDI